MNQRISVVSVLIAQELRHAGAEVLTLQSLRQRNRANGWPLDADGPVHLSDEDLIAAFTLALHLLQLDGVCVDD